ncbi:hypothetical protein BJ912DRAFT_1147173 [Pholiota molesta]|nr:hypothetical protein BJ912DRAFT_1147173 [Pholiota molesta]
MPSTKQRRRSPTVCDGYPRSGQRSLRKGGERRASCSTDVLSWIGAVSAPTVLKRWSLRPPRLLSCSIRDLGTTARIRSCRATWSISIIDGFGIAAGALPAKDDKDEGKNLRTQLYVTASTDSVARALDIKDIQHSSDDLTWPPAPPGLPPPPARKASIPWGREIIYATPVTCNERHTYTGDAYDTRQRERTRRVGSALCWERVWRPVSGSYAKHGANNRPASQMRAATAALTPLSKSRPRPVSQPHPTDSRDSYLHIGSLPRPSTPPFFKHPRTAFPDNGLCPWAQSCMHSTPGSSSPSILLPRRECLPRCYRHQQPFDPRRPRGIEEDSVGRCPALRKESALDLRTHYRCPSNSDVRWPVYAVIRVPLVRLARTPYTNGKRAQHPPSSPAQLLARLCEACRMLDTKRTTSRSQRTTRRTCSPWRSNNGYAPSWVSDDDGGGVRSDSIRGVLRSPTAAIPFRAPVPFLCRVSFSSSFTPGSSSPPLYFCGATCYLHQKPLDTRRPRGVEEDSEGRAPPIPRDRY